MWAVDDYYAPVAVTIRVRTDSEQLGAEVRRLLGAFEGTAARVPGRRTFRLLSPGDLVGGTYALLSEDRVLQRATTVRAITSRLLSEINREALHGTPYFAVHAGAIARDGRVIALPGASGAGKTTLSAACLLAGFEYVSDEALCVAYGTGVVVPYPKPLMLAPDACRILGLPAGDEGSAEVAFLADDLGSKGAARPARLSDIILFDRTGDPPVLVSLPQADGMAALLRYSFNHFRRPEDAFRLAGALAGTCRTHVLRFGSPHVAAELLRGSHVGRREGT